MLFVSLFNLMICFDFVPFESLSFKFYFFLQLSYHREANLDDMLWVEIVLFTIFIYEISSLFPGNGLKFSLERRYLVWLRLRILASDAVFE